MSNQARWRWKSGRLTSSPIQDFWGPTLSARDPQIPNLPLETPAAPGAGFPDSDDSWWSGAQRCFVGVALAGAAAALTVSVAAANSFKHQDEVPAAAAPTSVGGASFFNQRERVRTKFFSWPQTDELPGLAAPVALDDSGYTPSPRLTYPAVYAPWSDDTFVALAAQTALEEQNWEPPRPWASQAQFSVTWGQDELPSQAVALPYHDDWVAGWALRPSPVFAVFSAQDERPTPAVAFAHQDDGPQLLAAPYSVSGFIWATDETLPAVSTAYALAEDAWAPPAPRRPPPVLLVLSATDELVSQAPPLSAGTASFYGQRERSRTKFWYWGDAEGLPSAAAPAFVEDDVWVAPNARPAVVSFNVRWEQDELPSVVAAALEAPEWSPIWLSAAPALFSLWADDELPTLAFAPTEDAWTPAVPTLAPPVFLLWEEEGYPQALAAPAEDDAWAPPQYRFPPDLRVWGDSDEYASFALAEDEWATPVPAWEPPTLRLWFQQDEVTTPPVPLAADEDYWLSIGAYPPPPFSLPFTVPQVNEDFPKLSKPVDTGAHSGVYRRLLIELYEKDWAEDKKKRESLRVAELEAQAPRAARVFRVKKVSVVPTASKTEEQATIAPLVSAPKPAQGPTPLEVEAEELIQAATKNLITAIADKKKSEVSTLKQRRRKAEEEAVVAFLVSQGLLN